MSQSKQDECAGAAWTSWLALDEVAVPMALYTGQTLDELGDTLLHVAELGLLRFGRDEAGALYFQTRMDQAARVTAWLDDYVQVCRNYEDAGDHWSWFANKGAGPPACVTPMMRLLRRRRYSLSGDEQTQVRRN